MSLYTIARSIYRKLRCVPFLSPILERMRGLVVVGSRNRILAAATLDQGRQLAATRDLVNYQTELIDAHAQALSGLKLGNERLAARLAAVEARTQGLTAGHNALAAHVSQRSDELALQINQRVEFIRQETLFELRKATGLLPAHGSGHQESVQSRILNPAKLAAPGPRRVNLGCGHLPIVDMINVDSRDLPGVDLVAEVSKLPFDSASVDEIHAAHLLEHFPIRYLEDVLLPYWRRLLKPEGILRLIVPDAEAMLEDYRQGLMSFDEFALVTFGGQDYEGDFHYAMFTPETLRQLLERTGYGGVKILASGRKNGLCREMELSGSPA